MAATRQDRLVLVHGAWEGGWVFGRVAARLRREPEVSVHCVTLTGCGERHHLLTREVSLATHVEDVVSMLRHEDLHDVVLVGHSYGGTVVTGVADREPGRVRRVVYLDASCPVDGQNATGAFEGGSAVSLEQDAWLAPPPPASVFGVTAAEDLAWVDARRHPHPVRTLQEPVRLSGAVDRVPRSYLACKDHAALVAAFGGDPLAVFVDRARKEGWPTSELDAPHAAAVTAPEQVSEALLEHARLART